jgi:hypothetical protein
MSTQARLPGTLPTPAVARANLRMARRSYQDRQNVVDGMKDRLSAAHDEVKAAGAELDEVEQDLLAADEGSSEDLAADERHGKAMKRAERAANDVIKVAGALRLAQSELADGVRLLAGARGELAAIREGRRKRK